MAVNYGGSRVVQASSEPLAAQGRPTDISGFESLARSIQGLGRDIGEGLRKKRENDIRIAANESRLNEITATMNTPENILDTGKYANIKRGPGDEFVFEMVDATSEQIKMAKERRDFQIEQEASSLAQFFTAQTMEIDESQQLETAFGPVKVNQRKKVPLYSSEEALGLAKGIVSQPRQVRDDLIQGALSQKRLEVSGLQKAQIRAFESQAKLAEVQAKESEERSTALQVERTRGEEARKTEETKGTQRRLAIADEYRELEEKEKRGERITQKDLLRLAVQSVIASSKESQNSAFLSALGGTPPGGAPGSASPEDLATKIFGVLEVLSSRFKGGPETPAEEAAEAPATTQKTLSPAEQISENLRKAAERRKKKQEEANQGNK